ncbi:hypothetical protein ACFP3U_11290 [Kitasatospora misakiensis]|uniref:Uncharacterized protein n=1 Tax=Kitasatospora misakiensis TaxID=67330 RepID=A0ABW0X1B4_9ACTN
MPTLPTPTSSNVDLTPALREAIAGTILDCLVIAEAAFPDLASGQGAQADKAAIRENSMEGMELAGRLTLHRIALGVGKITWSSGRDYLRAAAHDLTRHDPDAAWSTTSLVRSALEAEAGFGYLFKAESNVQKRLGRTASMLLTDARYVSQQARALGEPTISKIDSSAHGLDRICSHAGVRVLEDGERSKQQIEVGGARVSHELVIANVISGFWPKEAVHPYTLLSGAAHSRPWMLASGVSRGPTAINVLIVSGLVLSTWLDLAGTYAGVDLTAEMDQVSGYIAGTATEALNGVHS